jgi:molybdenum cofactor cytidylyltransferase
MPQTIAGVILAAGASSRMGRPKQLLDWGGMPLVRAAALNALGAGLAPVLVVTGGAQEAVEGALANLPVQLVHNASYAEGQSTSLRAGIAALGAEPDAALVLLGDQPFVTREIIQQLVAAYRAKPVPDAHIVAPRYRGVRGNPVLFGRSVFPDLLTVAGDQGARTILAARAAEIRLVDIDDERPLADIDTPEEYERLQREQTQ